MLILAIKDEYEETMDRQFLLFLSHPIGPHFPFLFVLGWGGVGWGVYV